MNDPVQSNEGAVAGSSPVPCSPPQILGDWYECAPYGEQVPRDLPDLMIKFLAANGKATSEEEAWEMIAETDYDHPWTLLFECIFCEAVRYTILHLENAGVIPENVEGQAVLPGPVKSKQG